MPGIAADLATAAVARITTIGIPGATVVERARPAVIEGDTFPLVCVTVLTERLEPYSGEDARAWFGHYLLVVTVVTRKAGIKPDDNARDYRAEIVSKLARPTWAELSAVDDSDPVQRVIAEPAGLDKAYYYSPAAFDVRTIEAR